MGILNNVFNGVIDLVKLAIIAVVCLVVIIIGGYLLADLIGLIPEATGLYRPLSVETILTDLPFIGSNMIYLIIGMAILVIAYVAFDIYGRKKAAAGEAGQTSENLEAEGTAETGKVPPEAPEIKR
ncbi:hypothetical protein [Methanocella sp. MCL-LM]|uniref:hypothetical protein n=1 Tax=Methanocella sp. MCL-LM TaxID=3412035 RepID=UPI003C771161